MHQRPLLTARPASPQNRDEPDGIPFYLPKPLLVISKNVYHIEEAKVGLTDTAPIPTNFDAQAQYADVNNRSTVSDKPIELQPSGDEGEDPPASRHSSPRLHSGGAPISPSPGQIPDDGLAPHIFFTYEIVFVPDLTQKYVMEVRGGPGEVRAAMNLVNGWQFTGLGPYYVKDSSTAQNILSTGIAGNLLSAGASDVITNIADLRAGAETGGRESFTIEHVTALVDAMDRANTTKTVEWNKVGHPKVSEDGRMVVPRIENYAEVHIWEPIVVDGQLTWRPVIDHAFSREVLGAINVCKRSATPPIVIDQPIPESDTGPTLAPTIDPPPAPAPIQESSSGSRTSTEPSQPEPNLGSTTATSEEGFAELDEERFQWRRQ
jgi:hypothetical protein